MANSSWCPFRSLLALLLVLASGACAARQPVRVFADLPLQLKPGHTAYVIDDTGTETRGKVVSLSPASLLLSTPAGRRTFEAPRIRQVQRYGDSLWNGMIIGLAVGLPGTLIGDAPRRPCPHDPTRQCASTGAALIGQRATGLAVMAGIGAGIDALMRSRRQVYLAPGGGAP